MTRLTGFLSGLLLVVALAVAAVRYLPAEFFAGNVADEPVPAADPTAGALPSLPRVDNAPPAAADTGADAAEHVAAARDTQEEASSADGTDDAADLAGAVLSEAEPDETPGRSQDPTLASGPAPQRESASPAATDPAPRQWHAFWQPFHSEISAEGFRRRLEGVTGLDYRVVSPRPGEYQVAFAYRDEAERLAHLAAIEAATGLVLRSKML